MDIDELLVPLSDDAPSGEDLEYDPEFGELERTAAGTPAQIMGDATTEAIPPDWRSVREQSVALFERTRDLRTAVHLANALLNLEGFEGFRDGLRLVKSLSETLWDTVHPQLDEDDQDPMIRCNAVGELVSPDKTLAGVLDTPFVEARQAGRFGLRDIRVANGEMGYPEGDDRQPPSMDLIEAAFREVEPEALESTQTQVEECVTLVDELAAYYVAQVGAADAPDLSELKGYLSEASGFMSRIMGRIGVGDAAVEESWEESGGDAGTSSGGAPISGDVRSTADVLRMIDKICLYYDQREPSSPVPILLRRAASLVNKSFVDIIADLAPSGVSEIKHYEAVADSTSSGVTEDWNASSESESSGQEDDWG